MTAPVIAILDNDPAFLSLMDEMLTDEGYIPLLWHTVTERDPYAHLRGMLLRGRSPALVMLDLWLERRDEGWDFLKRLWSDPITRHVPTLVVSSGHPLSEGQANLLRVMNCPMLGKPFDLEDLLRAIASACDPPAADRDHGGRGISRPISVDERAQMNGWAMVGTDRTDALW